MKHIQSGFTLIELMIVVAIIGILASVALPAYQDYLVRSQVSESQTLASGLQSKVADYFSASGAFPGTNALAVCGDGGSACSGGAATDNKGQYVTQVAVGTGGAVTVTFGNKASTKIAGKLLTLRPGTDNSDNVTWICGYSPVPSGINVASHGATNATNVDAKFLPVSCR